MKIKIKKNRVKETLNRLAEISAGSIGLDPKRDTTLSDDDLLNLISQSDIDKNPHYRYMLENGYIPINRPPVQYAARKKKDSYDDYDDFNDIQPDMSAKIGEGAYGVVYEATKVGTDKRYAVKITGDANEVNIRRKLEAAREKLPESIMAHFVRVQDIVELDKEQSKVRNQKPLYLIAMQLVRPMNNFESTALYAGVSALKRMTVDFNLKTILVDKAIFKEVYTSRLNKFNFADDLVFHFKNSVKNMAKDKDPDVKLQLANQFNEKLGDDLVARLDDSQLSLWKNKMAELMAEQPTGDINKLSGIYAAASVEVAKNICKIIAAKDAAFYNSLLREFGLGELLDASGSLEDFLFDQILNLSSQFQFGIRTELRDFLKNRYGKDGEEYNMTTRYSQFINNLKVGHDKEKIREKFNQIAEKMPEKVKNFMGALMTLALDEGILWRDLHEGNVMVDPQTREYVAVDVGLFQST